MSSPPSQRQRQNSPNEPPPGAAAAALAAAAAMKQASSEAVVRICGISPSECGYCKGSRAKSPEEANSSSRAYSLLGDYMTPETYEGFLYRGWRRSGTYLYKPDNWTSCCPALTIRLPVKLFEPSKSQRKVVKKMDQVLRLNPQQKQQPKQQQDPVKRGHKRKHPSQSTEETRIEQGQVLDTLQQWTKPILQSFLEGYAANNESLNLSQLKIEPTFKIRAPPGKKRKESTDPVTVCTTVCAAVAGQSKGVVTREELSQQLMEKLKQNHAGKINSLSSPKNSTLQSTWTISEVTRHAKSGQVFCDITLQDPLQNGNSHFGNDDASMKDASSSVDVSPDKLQQWLEVHGASMAQFTDPLHGSDDDKTPPYPFTMETVPAHQSALDPAVHKLYFLYQSKVHQDVDPFTCDLNDKEALSNSSSNMNMGGADDPNQMEDDEWATPATNDGNDVLPQNRPGRLTPPPPPAPGGNQYNRNPPGFVDTAKRMLQREYSNLPNDRLKQIVKSFGSFYQFLVESPFALPSNGHGGATATVTTTPSSPNSAAPIHLPPGTYHQQYRVAGILVAVGVVDILPQGLSSVYLFYHPQFARDLVPLGKYAILQEIEFAKSLQLPYYYLGYYIESCTKMRYKAEYKPSQLLCPTSYKWVDAELAQKIIPIFSPVHHCCTLYYEDQKKLEEDLQVAAEKTTKESKARAQGNSSDSDAMMEDHLSPSPLSGGRSTAGAPTKSILKKPNPAPPNPHVDQVKMDVGVNVPVTLNMLHERGRDTVRPLLEDFVKEAGPYLSSRCLVKFN